MKLLKYGSRGKLVKQLQIMLKNLGYNLGPIDGIFGYRTESAVKSFQADAGLKIDGIVGPETWAALNQTIVSTAKRPQGVLDLAKRFWWIFLIGLVLLGIKET